MLKIMDSPVAEEGAGLLTDLDEIARQGAQKMLASALEMQAHRHLRWSVKGSWSMGQWHVQATGARSRRCASGEPRSRRARR